MRSSKYHIVALFTLAAAVFMLQSLAGCDATADPDWGIIVTGTVTDSAAGYGIDSVRIDYDPAYPLDTFRIPLVYTNSQGQYRFDTDGIGPYYLIARKPGYLTQIRTISSPRRKATLNAVDFKLVRVIQ